ncbi:MAG: protein kinase, partial [Gemmataceae bacterium]|nr:protein kinase [Gemmataceae bacterium]
KKEAALREEIAKVAAASAEEAKKVAEQVARQVLAEGPGEDRLTLELYLAQLPGAVRQSLKRADDPTGRTVPPDFAVGEPEDLAKMLPMRVPHFRPGAGGFGEVWLARHVFLPTPRAVKFCTDPKVRSKLTSHEGRVIARVMEQGAHPNVVQLLDAMLDGETPWLMYEFVGGGCLTDLIYRWQSLSDSDRETAAVQALAQLAAAVGGFHRLTPPIVHRDLKPANILLHAEGRKVEGRNVENGSDLPTFRPDDLRLRITDFGIGGVAVDYLRTNPAGVSVMAGWLETSLRGSYTPLYASPQQSRGAKPDPRDDVHALGVMGYQMLTGKLTEAPGPRFTRELQRRNVSETLIDLIGDCVDPELTGRPKDAAELAERLHALKKLTLPATPPTPLPAGRRETDAGLRQAREDKPAPASAGERSSSPLPSGKVTAGVGSAAPSSLPSGRVTAGVGSAAPTKWLLPVRGIWFTRPTADRNSPWAPSTAKLPGEITIKPDEAYRLALNPDATGDTDLEKLAALAGLPGLEAIDLSGCQRVTDAGVRHLARLPGLKAVGLADTQVTDSGVALLLTRFPGLEAVGLAGADRVSQTVVPYLARLHNLKLLALPPRA